MQPIEEEPLDAPAQEMGPDIETVAAIEAGEADEAAPFEADEQSFKDKHIFISHKCDVEPDETIAAMLYSELSKLGCDVYFDKAQPLGARYEDAIGDSLKKADFVVALLTQHANESDWVKFELDYAYAQFHLHGRPTILPVGLGLSLTEVSMRIGARVAGFTARSYDLSDREEILADVKASISNEPRVRERIDVGMEGFLVRKFRRNIMRVASLDLPELRRGGEVLQGEKLFWVVGDASIRNHFARSLAVNEYDREINSEAGTEGRNIYEVPKSLSWSKVDDQLVGNSIIIFPDVNPSLLFDEESPRDELKSLKRLSERNHVIVTTSADSYSEIEREMRDRDFEGGAQFVVSHNFYNESTRLEIFKRLVDFSHESDVITQRQQRWARGLLEESEGGEMFRTIINKWSPADIERFVTRHLPEVKRQGDIRKLLQRNADLDNEIHTWFVALDDSTRCFVLAVAMLSGLRKEQLWENYKLIVQQLKKLDGNLSLWPLGIGRQRAALYVTTEGQVDFIDERIAEAICREVSKNFREYLIELRELIQEISVPKGREKKLTKEVVEERKLEAAKSKEVRVALARVTGKAGRRGLEDLTKLLSFWGADSVLAVREAVALCLEEAVAERTGAQHALALMEKWCNDPSNRDDAFFRRLAAASALASIMVAGRGRDVYERALGLLDRLAISDYASIKFYVSISLRKTARKVPLVEKERPVSLATLLTSVARDENPKTKINVAETLIEARIANETAAMELIRDWVSAEDQDRRWAAMCSLFLWRKQEDDERNREFIGFLTLDRKTAVSVLVEVLNHKHQKMTIFWRSFKQLVRKADEATLKALVSGLAGQSQASLDEKLWLLLRASAEPLLSGLVSEVRAEKWRRMFSTPAEFIVDLHKEVQQEHLAGEVYAAVARLLKPEPEGCRSEFVQALVSCFPERRAILDDILKRLTIIAPQVLDALSVEIRSEGLKKLFDDPLILIGVIAESLSNTEISGETSVALEFLAQPEPRGSREKMIEALTAAQELDVAGLRTLLWQFRATGSTELSALSYEFNLHTLESDLLQPERFLSRVTEAMRDPKERVEVLQLLRQLSMAEPHGRRRTLIQALGVSRVTRPTQVDALLYETSWQTSAGLISLRTEVKLFSFLSRVFSPGLISKVFAPQR